MAPSNQQVGSDHDLGGDVQLHRAMNSAMVMIQRGSHGLDDLAQYGARHQSLDECRLRSWALPEAYCLYSA
jgi:hypothetical protein